MQISSVRTRSWCAFCTLFVMGLISCVVTTPVQAAKYAGAFMENGGGARALALGGAFVALADDPSTTFWNPAGLATAQERQLLLMHSERFGDLIDRDFAAYVQPVDWSLFGGQEGGFGVSVIRLGIDDIPFTDHLTDQLDENGDGEVDNTEILELFNMQDQIRFKSDQEWALFLSYGERKGQWQVGGSLKMIRQSVGDFSSIGIGFDAGLFRPQIWRRLDFGVKFQDITTTYLSWSTGTNEIIAPAVIPGVAYTFPLPSWNAAVLLTSAFETRFENRRGADQYWTGSISTNAHLGLEMAFSDRVFLRGGFDSGWEMNDLTAGVGFVLKPLTVDYAYAGDTLDIDEVTHRLSLTARF
ncbi:MAG: PorV/PorQ family protein [bacterium]